MIFLLCVLWFCKRDHAKWHRRTHRHTFFSDVTERSCLMANKPKFLRTFGLIFFSFSSFFLCSSTTADDALLFLYNNIYVCRCCFVSPSHAHTHTLIHTTSTYVNIKSLLRTKESHCICSCATILRPNNRQTQRLIVIFREISSLASWSWHYIY